MCTVIGRKSFTTFAASDAALLKLSYIRRELEVLRVRGFHDGVGLVAGLDRGPRVLVQASAQADVVHRHGVLVEGGDDVRAVLLKVVAARLVPFGASTMNRPPYSLIACASRITVARFSFRAAVSIPWTVWYPDTTGRLFSDQLVERAFLSQSSRMEANVSNLWKPRRSCP